MFIASNYEFCIYELSIPGRSNKERLKPPRFERAESAQFINIENYIYVSCIPACLPLEGVIYDPGKRTH